MNRELQKLQLHRATLAQQAQALQEDLRELDKKIRPLRLHQARENFRLLAQPLWWAAELSPDLKHAQLVAWVLTDEDRAHAHQILTAFNIEGPGSRPLFPSEPGVNLSWDGKDLRLKIHDFEKLPAYVERLGLNLTSENYTIEKIDRKIQTLEDLRRLYTRLIPVD